MVAPVSMVGRRTWWSPIRGAPHWVLVVGKDGDEYLVKDPLVTDAAIVKLGSRTSTIRSVRVLHRPARP